MTLTTGSMKGVKIERETIIRKTRKDVCHRI
jgi:hypothetical protein